MAEMVIPATLTVLNGADEGLRYDLNVDDTVLGRDAKCEVVLHLQTVSRRHARIVRDVSGFTIEDLGSLNGTYVNGLRISAPTRLHDHDKIQVHEALLSFDLNPAMVAAGGVREIAAAAVAEGTGPRRTTVVSSLDVVNPGSLRSEVNSQVKLEAVLEIIANAGTTLDIDEVLPKILESLFRIFPQAESGYVLLVEGPREELLPRAIKQRAHDNGGSPTMGPVNATLARRAMEERQAILSSDIDEQPFHSRQTIFEGQPQAIMCAPLIVPSSPPLGAIQISTNSVQRPFQADDLEVLASIAMLVGQLVSLARWHERKHSAEVMAREHAAAEREQHRLRAVLEVLPVGVFVADAQGKLLETNAACREIWEGPTPHCNSPEEYGEAYPAWWPSTGRRVASHEWGLSRAIATGEPCLGEEMTIRAFNGRIKTILNYALPFRDAANRITGGVAVNIDITALKQTEEALKDADRRKNEFLAMLAHELRNPLAPLSNAVMLLKLGTSDEARAQTVSIMERQVEQLVRLVDDLLDVSRIMRGKIELRKETITLQSVITRAVETAQPVIATQGHQLAVTLPDEPVYLEADAIRLAQVIANLLNNAAKYTEPSGSICLTVTRGAWDVVICVADTGIGIAPEMLPHVFDIFSQADRSLDRSQGGLGIGLSLVQKLVELHGGRVRATSAGLGKGSEFTIRLPASAGAQAQESPAFEPTPMRPRRILVVDDQMSQAEILAEMLRQFWGHEVHFAHDGPAALELAVNVQPEMIVLDIGLPQMDGYEVARQLRGQPAFAETLLVALTGYGQDDDRRRTREAGFDVHLVKPASVAMLQQLFSHPRMIAKA